MEEHVINYDINLLRSNMRIAFSIAASSALVIWKRSETLSKQRILLRSEVPLYLQMYLHRHNKTNVMYVIAVYVVYVVISLSFPKTTPP